MVDQKYNNPGYIFFANKFPEKVLSPLSDFFRLVFLRVSIEKYNRMKNYTKK